jgi:hypothetical protein
MSFRTGIATFVAVLLALPISIGFASANSYPVGRAYLSELNTSGISGVAIVSRQVTAGQTHVMVRLSGVTAGQAVTWQIVGGAVCNQAPTSTLMGRGGSIAATKLGTVMSSDYQARTLNVTSGSGQMTLRVYDYSKGVIGAELACGQIYGQPSLGSMHWW